METEYAAGLWAPDGTQHDVMVLTEELLAAQLPPEYERAGFHLRNGAKLHIDCNHPEYATDESDTIEGAVEGAFAGDKIVPLAMAGLTAYPEISRVTLNRRSADPYGNAWGTHLNLLCERRLLTGHFKQTDVVRTLGMHCVTANVYLGSGMLTSGGQFLVAQKAAHVSCDVSELTTNGTKPIIVKRDEPHADSGEYARLQVVGVDATMSPWQTRMLIGTAALVLDAVELGYSFRHLYAKQDRINEVARKVANDPGLRRSFRLDSGARATALEVQRGELAVLDKMREDGNMRDQEKLYILEEMKRALADAGQNPDLLLDRCDWPARLRELRRFQQKHDLPHDAPEMLDRDYQFDSLGTRSLGLRLRDTVWSRHMPDPDAVAYRMQHGCPTTRAADRSRFIHAMASVGELGFTHALWTNITHKGNPDRKFQMPDPFAHDDQRIAQYIRMVTREGYDLPDVF